MQKKKRYQTLEKLSEGQFGTVFKGLDTETNQTVAIKKMYVSLKHNSPAAKNVLREIDCIKRIDHENVLKLLDYEVKETSVKLVIEYMDYDLKSFIDSMPSPLKNSKVKGIAKMILEGLKATHAQGILHRDLKPSNILINSEGVVKIGDFGSAIHVSNTEDGKFEIEGFSRWYKAPEILYGSRSYDFRADIWSFACIYGELLNGSPMFPGINDFDQISKIIKVLGTANTENWPEMEQLPDYGKVMFSQHPAQDLNIIFPNATKSELEFVRTVLTYARPKTIDDVLVHQYFQENPQPKRYKHVKIMKPDQEARIDYQALLNLTEQSS